VKANCEFFWLFVFGRYVHADDNNGANEKKSPRGEVRGISESISVHNLKLFLVFLICNTFNIESSDYKYN